jgi:putative ABC transport system permease protein
MSVSFTLAARYLKGRRLRAILTTLAVVFGVMIMFGMNVLVPTVTRAYQSTMLAASDKVDVTVSQKSGGVFPASVYDVVRSAEGVRASQPLLARSMNVPPDYFDHDPAVPDRVSALSVIGLDPSKARDVRSYPLREGRFLESTDMAASVVSASLAEVLGLRLGSTLDLPATDGVVSLTVVGIRPARALPGNEEVLVPLAEAQAMFDQPGELTAVEANLVSADAARQKETRERVQAALGSTYTIEAPSTEGNLATTLQASQLAFTAFAVLALFMGAFIIFNTFRTIVAERRRDIGMLRAIGASRPTVVRLFLVEGLIQGVLGTAIGMVLGYLLALLGTQLLGPMMSRFMSLHVGLPPVPPGLVVVSVVVGVGVTLAAGFFPALSAGRLTPMEVLRPSQEPTGYRRRLGVSGIAGLVFIGSAFVALASKDTALLALGALLFMTGLVLLAPVLVRPLALAFGAVYARLFAREGTGVIARSNLLRQPSRAAVTASTTMIALAVIVALGAMMSSISDGFLGILRRSMGSDYIFVPPSIGLWQNNVGAKGSLADRLRSIRGVEEVSTLRYAAGVADVAPTAAKGGPATGGVQFSLIGIDPVAFPKVSALSFTSGSEVEAMRALSGERSMVANPIFATAAGLKVGSVVPVLTAQGTVPYTVVAVATDFMDVKIATAFVSQRMLEEDFHQTADVLIQVNLAPGADTQAADAEIRQAAAGYPQFQVVRGKEIYDQMSSLFTAVFAALYLLFAFFALPSLITMLNTLAIGVMERTREIGMLRAVGTTRAQVRRIILAEAILLASFGVVFGLAAGTYLGYLLVRAMTTFGLPGLFILPWQAMIAAAAIGLGFGALAAIVPSRRAARLEIVEALRYE